MWYVVVHWYRPYISKTRRRTAALPCPARCRAACPKQRAVALPSTPGRLLLAPPACCPHAALAARTQLAHCSRGPHAARTSPVLPCAARAVCSLLARRPLPAALCRPPPAALRAALPALPACALPERPTHCPATPAHAPALPLLHCLHRQLAPCPALLARLLLLLAPPAHTPAGTASELPNRAAQSSRPFEPPCRAALLSRSFLAAAGGFAVGGVGGAGASRPGGGAGRAGARGRGVAGPLGASAVVPGVGASSRVGCQLGAVSVVELEVLVLGPSALRHLLSLPPAATEFPVAGTTPLLLFPPTDQSQPQLLPGSPLPAPAPQTKVTESLTECCEPETRASTLVHARRVARPCAPAVQGTHRITLRPSSVPQRVVLPSPPASSLSYGPDPKSDLVCTASPTVTCLLAMVVTDPSFESAAASALVAEHVDFAALCRLDYVASLVFYPSCPPYVEGELALGLTTRRLTDRHRGTASASALVLSRGGPLARLLYLVLAHGQLRLAYVATHANTANVFTKALGSSDQQRFCIALGLEPTLPHLLVS
ncbi:unnamed protein product [Closterium sp. NIES-54]